MEKKTVSPAVVQRRYNTVLEVIGLWKTAILHINCPNVKVLIVGTTY